MHADESYWRYVLKNSHRQSSTALSHQNAYTFWSSCEKIVSILASIAIWKFKHLINEEQKKIKCIVWLSDLCWKVLFIFELLDWRSDWIV